MLHPSSRVYEHTDAAPQSSCVFAEVAGQPLHLIKNRAGMLKEGFPGRR
jgi:hypothetical protein